MKFVCDRCQTKYSIADEKVRGKILKVRCKACSNIITVRGEPAPGATLRRASSAALPTVGGSAPHAVVSAPRPPPPPSARPAAPRPVAVDDGVQWYMALDGDRSGPFSRKQLLEGMAPLPADADLHVWNEQLGSWKPPGEVPDLAAELAMRRRPPGPPPFPGAPRRPTPSPPVSTLAAAPRSTGAHAVAAAIGPGVGLRLPPPSGAPASRRATGPVARPAGLAAASATLAEGIDVDPSTLLETPGPQPHMLHGLAGNNGFAGGAHASGSGVPNGAPAAADKSDMLSTLNLAAAVATISGSSPRLLSAEALYRPDAVETPAGRQRSARIVVAFLCVIALICVVFMLSVTKKPRPTLHPVATVGADPLAGVVDKTPGKPAEAPPPIALVPVPAAPAAAVAPVAPVAPPAAAVPAPMGGRLKGKAVRGHAARGRGPAAGVASPGAPSAGPATAEDSANARYRDTSRPGLSITGGGGVSRPGPSQSDISRVINNNRGGIKNCYQRALLRDSSLTHGKITVQVTVGISGRVKRVGIDGPPQFRALDPCIKEVVGRWAFPPGGDEYGTEFAYVFQGNE
jgi:predicted Zn finger-like uncharacterized protein